MEFKKYNSIENLYQEDFLNAVTEQGYADLEYAVQEKIHGAHLSIITDGNNIIAAKRTGIIEQDEYFFNAHLIVDRYKNNIIALSKEITDKYPVKTITIFGELFGGGYPHPDVTPIDNAKLVQRGIYYCPQNELYVFDIMLDNEKYLDVDEVSALFDKHGFFSPKVLFKGKLKDCLAYPNDFKTTIPASFGLPELEGNISEGVVIRPVTSVFLRTGSRVIIKNKNEAWAENNKYIDKDLLSKLLHEGEELSDEATLLCEQIYKHVTENRLVNLISKLGEINPKKDLGKLLGLFNKDVLTDFFKDYREQYEKLEKHEAKAVNQFLNKQAAKLINDYFNR